MTIYICCVSLGNTDGDDYDTGAFPLSVVFLAGDGDGAVRCATQNVSITQDSEPEGTEDFTIYLVVETLSGGRVQVTHVMQRVHPHSPGGSTSVMFSLFPRRRPRLMRRRGGT